MKIALIAPTHLPARRANTIQVMKMAQALAALGHDTRLVAPGLPPRPVSWDELAAQYGLGRRFPVEWLPVWPGLRSYDYGLQAVSWARRWRADLIFTRLPQAAALGSQMGFPTILEAHDLPQGRMGEWLFRQFLKGRGAQRLVVISRALAVELERKFGAPAGPPFTCIAPDGVDLERYASLPEPGEARRLLAGRLPGFPLAGERFTAGYTGHLYPGRGRELILEMAARLPETAFLLVGGGTDDAARLRDEVKSRNLENVIVMEFVPNAELPLYQAACDVLLLPYQRHVAASSGGDIARYLSPLKLFEYLACGRAILASDLPVLGEVLNASNAVILAGEDIRAWAEALTALQDHPERRQALGDQARRDAAAYTWERRAARILEGLP